METIEEAVVAIPFMTPFTASILAKAERLKLIIQYGVGLEGVDIEEVYFRTKEGSDSLF